MARLKVQDLESGMVLATDVRDPNGRFLLGESSELGEKHIKALQAWGVLVVDVEGVEETGSKISQQIAPDTLKNIQEEVRNRFRAGAIKHELIKELYREIINHECQLYMSESRTKQ